MIAAYLGFLSNSLHILQNQLVYLWLRAQCLEVPLKRFNLHWNEWYLDVSLLCPIQKNLFIWHHGGDYLRLKSVSIYEALFGSHSIFGYNCTCAT
jgi:hypothetical protein